MTHNFGWKSIEKLKVNNPDLITKLHNDRIHDRRLKLREKKEYMRSIFDPVIGCYFHDLIEQTDDKEKDFPKYFHIFLESNSRYAFAYPINDKTADTAIKTLEKFISDNGNKPIRKLTSDGEKGFDSEKFTNFCKSKGIMVKIVLDKAHSTLGLIDRFIRTLRDLNQPPTKTSSGTQYDADHINFSAAKMKILINRYNNSPHRTIGCSPKEMYDHPELEKKWIQRKLKLQHIQDQIEDFVIPKDSFVRYRMNTMDLNGRKRRSEFSREKYKVVGRVGVRYVIRDNKGKQITKSRFELIRADDNDPPGEIQRDSVFKSSKLYI